MKYRFILSIFVIAVSSCGTKTPCKDQYTYMLMFYKDATTPTIADTMATLVSYKKGSNFQTVVDTFDRIRFGGSSIPSPQPLYFSASTSPLCYNYDWLITLHPSGKQYRLKDITHQQRSVKNLNSSECSNDVSYSVNDSSYFLKGQEGQPSGTAYMPVRY